MRDCGTCRERPASRLARLAVCLVLFATAAHADPSQQTAQTTTPASIGTPHVCAEYYPPLASAFGSEGTTLLSFTITPTGTVENPVVARSSGDELLDQASLTCVKRWLYKPAIKDGVAVSAPWQVNVLWKLHDEERAYSETPRNCARYNGVTQRTQPVRFTLVAFQVSGGEVVAATTLVPSGDVALDEKAVECVKTFRFALTFTYGYSTDGSDYKVIDWSDPDDLDPVLKPPVRIVSGPSPKVCAYPVAARKRQSQGDVPISFHVGADGAVRNPAVLRSSGDSDLDSAAVACLASWRFQPATLNNTPVEMHWRMFVHWILGQDQAQ